MLRFKESECLLDVLTNLEGTSVPIRLYVSLCEKFSNGIKWDHSCILFAADMGCMTDSKTLISKNPVLIGGRIDNLKLLFKHSQKLPFNPLNYDGSDFAVYGCYLTKLVASERYKNKNIYPKDFLDYEYESGLFDYIKPKEKVTQLGFQYKTFDKRTVSLTIPSKSSNLTLQKTQKIFLPPKVSIPLKVKLPEKPKLAVPSNMKVVSYE